MFDISLSSLVVVHHSPLTTFYCTKIDYGVAIHPRPDTYVYRLFVRKASRDCTECKMADITVRDTFPRLKIKKEELINIKNNTLYSFINGIQEL